MLLTHDYILDVKCEVIEHTKGSEKTTVESVTAAGCIMNLPMELMSPGSDNHKVFHRWHHGQVKCTIRPVGLPAPYTNPHALKVYGSVCLNDVGGQLVEGHCQANSERIVLVSTFHPAGPYGERIRRYMKVVPTITLRARYLTDENGRVTGVPGWDLVLPDNWQLVGRERQSTYNTPTHPDFIKSLGLIHEKCKEDGLDFSLHYEEGTDMWSIGIRPMEYEKRFMTGECVLSNAVEEALDHLNIVGD